MKVLNVANKTEKDSQQQIEFQEGKIRELKQENEVLRRKVSAYQSYLNFLGAQIVFKDDKTATLR